MITQANTHHLMKYHEPTFLIEITEDEGENNHPCTLDLPLFITTSEQREEMNKAMKRAKVVENKPSRC